MKLKNIVLKKNLVASLAALVCSEKKQQNEWAVAHSEVVGASEGLEWHDDVSVVAPALWVVCGDSEGHYEGAFFESIFELEDYMIDKYCHSIKEIALLCYDGQEKYFKVDFSIFSYDRRFYLAGDEVGFLSDLTKIVSEQITLHQNLFDRTICINPVHCYDIEFGLIEKDERGLCLYPEMVREICYSTNAENLMEQSKKKMAAYGCNRVVVRSRFYGYYLDAQTEVHGTAFHKCIYLEDF